MKTRISYGLVVMLILFATDRSGAELKYGVGDWPLNLDFGSHRVKVRVESKADAVWVHIPWRRRDRDPEAKAVIILDGKTGERLGNAFPVAILREYGDIVFQPVTAPGDYYVYYLPHRAARGCIDANSYRYIAPMDVANPDPVWLERNGLTHTDLSASGEVGWFGWHEADRRLAAMPDALIKTDNDSVLRVTVPGGEISTFASGTGAGTGGCAWGPDHHLYVADREAKDIRKYDSAGTCMGAVDAGLPGANDLLFAPAPGGGPLKLFTSSGGIGGHEIYRRTDISTGFETHHSPAAGYGSGVRESTIDNAGNFWITIPHLNRIVVYDFATGTQLADYDDEIIPGEPAAATSQMTVRRSDGHVFAYQQNAKRVLELDPSMPAGEAVILNQVELGGTFTQGQSWETLSIGPDGNLYVLSASVYPTFHAFDASTGAALMTPVPLGSAAAEREQRRNAERMKTLAQAHVLEIQARTEFDRFDPMEVVATQEETEALLAGFPDLDYLVFPEDRRHPIRMFETIPLRWIQRGPGEGFSGEARPGEYYVFQLGIWAARQAIDDLAVDFSGLAPASPNQRPNFRNQDFPMTCFNLEGTDWLGRPREKVFEVPKGMVRALWIGVEVPEDASGKYRGAVQVRPRPGPPTTVQFSVKVSGEVLADHGDGELWRHARLRWLNSTLGLEETVIPPYAPLEVKGDTVRCQGRVVTFGRSGLPASIRSEFDHSELPADGKGGGREILAGPMRMVVETGDGPIAWDHAPTRVETSGESVRVQRTTGEGGPFSMTTRSCMEFDGCLVYEATLEAREAAEVRDIRLEVPMLREAARYMMGFKKLGGYRPAEWDWQWDVNWTHNMVWLGDADAGLQCKLMTEEGVWQWGNLKDTGLPASWWNDGNGGARIREDGERVVLTAFSGPRRMEAGQQLVFRFRFLITPFKPIDKRHWNWRIGRADHGATIKHMHHASPPNSYINYPFLETDDLAADVRREKARGIEKYMIYYTVRELSNHAAEIWALRSLGDEIFLTGDDRGSAGAYETMGDYAGGKSAGGYPWLQEHLVEGYSWRWMAPIPPSAGADAKDVCAGIATVSLSRWHNYYLEGLRWLMANTGIDGLYLDGIGYDREIMKRVARVMHRVNPGSGYLNFHSGNTGHKYGISPMNGYMEHLPYINELFFGELYDYQDSSPDYWLVEISGIPFGLTGEMLDFTPQHPGNQWRAMLYGMDGRNAPSKHEMWAFWDRFGIQETEMIGYWAEDCPVRTGREDVLATVYRKPDKSLIALAGWAAEDVKVELSIDWQALGLDPAEASLTAPAIEGFQDEATFAPMDEIPVEQAKGWLLIAEKR